jgi:hypothetical protein
MPATPDSCTHASGIFRRQARVHGRSALASTGKIYTIFEGTSETPRLVIYRAISGMRIGI